MFGLSVPPGNLTLTALWKTFRISSFVALTGMFFRNKVLASFTAKKNKQKKHRPRVRAGDTNLKRHVSNSSRSYLFYPSLVLSLLPSSHFWPLLSQASSACPGSPVHLTSVLWSGPSPRPNRHMHVFYDNKPHCFRWKSEQFNLLCKAMLGKEQPKSGAEGPEVKSPRRTDKKFKINNILTWTDLIGCLEPGDFERWSNSLKHF